MKQVLIIFTLCCVVFGAGGQNITKAEYFFDADPGFGNGTPINIGTSLPDKNNLTFNANVSSLTKGFHTLSLRSSSNGNWSLTNTVPVFKLDTASKIVAAEYFFDTDPGFGRATKINIGQSYNLVNFNFNASIASLPLGFHTMAIRTRDQSGRWGLTNVVVIVKVNGTIPNIVAAEYFLDSDPGFGNGTALNFSPAQDKPSVVFSLQLANASNGFHRLYIRSRDTYGNWSHTQVYGFLKYVLPANDSTVTMAEYYIDNDPGFGEGVPVTVNPAGNMVDTLIDVNITGLTAGTHRFFLRSRDKRGSWTLTNVKTFDVGAVPAAPAIVVNKMSRRTLCSGDQLLVSFHRTGTYAANNIFRAQLSDKNGSFAAAALVGTLTDTTSGIITCTLPSHLVSSDRYRIRVTSTNPAVTGLSSRDSLTINNRPVASVITGSSNVNKDVSYSYSVPSVNGSSWTWQATSGQVTPNANQASIVWNTAGLGRIIRVVETNIFGCIGDTTTKTVNVYTPRIDSVVVANLNPCPGASATVTAKATGVYAASNVFTAQLSNATGNFGSAVAIGTLAASPVGSLQPISIPVTLPFPLSNGTGYRVRVIANHPAVTSQNNGTDIVVSKPNLGTDKTISKCPGFAVNLTALFNTAGLTSSWNVARPDSVVNTGTYRLIVTNNANGCKDTAFVTVSNYNKPNLGNDTAVYVCFAQTRSITTVYSIASYPVKEWSTPNPAAVGPGMYTLVVATANGCRDTAVITVVERAALNPVISPAGTTSICSGDSVTYTVTGGTFVSYLWSNNLTTNPVVVKTAGNYTVTVTDSNGCSKTSAPVTLQVKSTPPPPNLSSSPANTANLCPGTSVTLTSSLASKYLWSTGDTTRSIITSVADTFTVSVFNAVGCSATSAPKIVSYLCPVPKNPDTVSVGTTSATVRWKHATCYKRYTVQYRVKGTIPLTSVNATDSSVVLNGLSAGTKYEWKVRTVCVTNPFTAGEYTAFKQFTTDSIQPRLFDPGWREVVNDDSRQAVIYPNPTSKGAVLQVGRLKDYVVTITNAEGKILWESRPFKSGSVTLPVEHFTSGVYLVSVKNKEATKTLRLIINR